MNMTANPLSPVGPTNGAALVAQAHTKYTPLDPMRVIRQYKWLLVLAAIVGCGLGVGLWWTLDRYAPQYTSETYLLIRQALQDPYQMTAEAGAIDRGQMALYDAYIQNQVIALQSYELLNQAIEHPRVKQTAWYKSYDTSEDRLEAMIDDLKPVRMLESTTMSVTFTAGNETDPPIILDTLIELFMSHNKRQNQIDGGAVRRVFDTEQRNLEDQKEQLQRRMKEFREEHDIETLDSENNEASIEYERLSEEVAIKKIELEAMKTYYTRMLQTQQENQITPSSEDVAEARANDLVKSREMKLSAMRETMKAWRERYGPQHPVVKRFQQQMRAAELERDFELDKLLREIASRRIEAVRKAIEGAAKQLAALQDSQSKAKKRMQDLLNKLKEYEAMETELKSVQDSLESVKDSLRAEQIRRQRPDVDRIVWSGRARVPEQTFPDFAVMTVGVTVLVLGFATGGAFLKEWLDQRIKSPSDLSLLPSTELLGVLPEADEDPSGPATVEGVVRKDPTGLMAEAFRQVRSTVTSRMDRRGYKTLLLCGVQANSGVSAVTSNLALSMAYNGRKTLILDANFRRPAHHELFGAPLVPGLVEVLQGTAELDAAIFHHADPAVDVVTTGAASGAPPELLEGNAFRNLLIELEKRYDTILVDGPPILVASDSTVLAKHVDAMALVVRAMSEKRGLVGRMLREFQNQRADMMGIILNSVRSSAGGYFAKNYKDFYRYRQSNGRKRRGRVEQEAAVTTES